PLLNISTGLRRQAPTRGNQTIQLRNARATIGAAFELGAEGFGGGGAVGDGAFDFDFADLEAGADHGSEVFGCAWAAPRQQEIAVAGGEWFAELFGDPGKRRQCSGALSDEQHGFQYAIDKSGAAM